MAKKRERQKRLLIKPGPEKLTSVGIKRTISIFSNVCGIFILVIGAFLGYKFLNINNTLAVIIFLLFLFIAVLVRFSVFTIGMKRARKKYDTLLNDLIVVKWGMKTVARASLLTIFSSILFFIIFILLIIPNIHVVLADDVIMGAHRGDSIKYIENTIPAIISAIENESYKFVEFDVQFTKDKQIVIHHDLSLLRLQKKLKYINELTYEELLEISDYHIPLYSEIMDLTAGKKPLNIEIKSQGDFFDDMDIVDLIIADTKARGIFNITLFSSVSSDVVKYIDREYPDAKTGKIYYISGSTLLNFEEFTNDMYVETERIGADYLMLHASNLRNFYALQEIKPENIDIVIWYFSNEMFIIPSEGHSILDKSGNIVGYSVFQGDRDNEIKNSDDWEIRWKEKKIFGSTTGFIW